MNIEIRSATLEDINNGLLEVFIEGYRYHQNGRPDVFVDLSLEEFKQDLINGFKRLIKSKIKCWNYMKKVKIL